MQDPQDIKTPRPQDVGMPRVPDDLTGLTVGRFVIERPVGAGGMGLVYRAEDSTLKRTVAIKRMAPQLRLSDLDRQRFLKEAQRASALNHPNVASVYDVLEFEGELFLVMEYIEGTTLRQRLRKEPLSLTEFMQLAIQCTEGLAAAHHRGIVHGDIKPENIMLTPSQRVKILDFGVARRIASEPTEVTQTLVTGAGFTSGTPAYMAPEMLQQLPYDGRADLFSLGLVFYEALGGRQPFIAESFAATLGRVLHVEAPPIHELNPSVPTSVSALVDRLLKKNPAERYANADELLGDLRLVEQGAAPKVATVALPSTRRHRTIRNVAVAATVLIAAALLWKFVPLRRTAGPAGTSVTAPATTQPRILAVLPSASAEGDAKLTALGQGILQSVSAKLTRLTSERPLEVVPPGNLQERNITSLAEAQKQTGATLGLSLDLRQAGDLIRVSYSLLDLQSGRTIGGDSKSIPATDVFAVEDEIAQGTITALQLNLRPDEQAAVNLHGTLSPAAYSYYLQARGYLLNFTAAENVDNAVLLLQQALKLDPNFGMAKAASGEAYWRKYWHTKEKKWTQLARKECYDAIKLGNAGPAGHICLGLVSDGTGQYPEAVTEYQRAVELDPTDENANIGLALALEHQDKIDAAERIFLATVESHPRSWVALNSLGTFYLRRAENQKAIETFRKVIALAPEGYAAYVNLGAILNRIDEPSQAIEPLKKSIALRPTYAAHVNVGTAYFQLKNFRQAAQSYEEAAKMRPNDYVAWGNLGEAHYYAGQKESAAPAYRKAIELASDQLKVNPHDADVLGYVANYYSMLGDRENALRVLEQALRYGRNDNVTFLNAAAVYNQLGETGLALEWLTKSIQAGSTASVIQKSPSFSNLYGNPRFQELMSSGTRNP